jgi:hypothetical protein
MKRQSKNYIENVCRGSTAPIINDEIRKNKLMWVKQEWRDTQGEDGDPEIDQIRCPD